MAQKNKQIRNVLYHMADRILFGSLITITGLTFYSIPAFASGTEIITNGFDVIYNLIAAVVSSIGTILLLWGVFEWAQSLNVQDGGAQSVAFKRIAAGLVATLGPQLIPIITSQIGA